MDITLRLKIKDEALGFFSLFLGETKMTKKWSYGGEAPAGSSKERCDGCVFLTSSVLTHTHTHAVTPHLWRYTPLIWKSLFKLVLLARFAQLLPYRKCQGCKAEAGAKYEVHDYSVLIRT